MTEITNAGEVEQSKLNQLRQNRLKVFYKSSFRFINEHNGLRPGCVHVLLGTTGSGKSSVTRAVVADLIKRNQESVYAWLSEEDTEELLEGLLNLSIGKDDLSKLLIESELTSQIRDADEVFERCELTGCKILILDNLTTSKFYMDKGIREQSEMVTRIKTFAARTGIAVFIVVHTKKDVTDNMSRLMTENDIRGCAALVNMAHFFYVFQRFHLKEKFYPTIRIAKARGQNIKDRLFALQYDVEDAIYVSDRRIDFDDFKKAYKGRNQL